MRYVVLAHCLSHRVHAALLLCSRHVHRAQNRRFQALDVVRVDEHRTLQLVGGARELAEHQGSGIVDPTGRILFGNQVHAVSKRSDEHHIGGEIERHHLFS